MLDITERERQGEGECNGENEKKGVNVGQWGGCRQGEKERREERKEVGEGELDQWRRNDWLRTKDERGETQGEGGMGLEEEVGGRKRVRRDDVGSREATGTGWRRDDGKEGNKDGRNGYYGGRRVEGKSK